MKVPHIIGADLSRGTIDFASSNHQSHIRVSNTTAGFTEFLVWLKQQNIAVAQTLVVMEHTGLYSYQLEQFLWKKKIRFTKVAALQIKRSMGMVRGKCDKTDAARIALYGSEKKDRLKVEQPADPQLQRLQLLRTAREAFVQDRSGYLNAVKEYRHSLHLKDDDPIISTRLLCIRTLTRAIEKIDSQIEEVVASQQQIKDNYELLQTIKGIGKVVALAAIIKTGNFKRFTDARKFACYCGIAPFEHRSGTSIRGRTRVSHLADKGMKTLLDLAAKTAIQYDNELKKFYLNKTAAGKAKMSTINIIRNKLVYRMFAVIKRQTPFIENKIQAV